MAGLKFLLRSRTFQRSRSCIARNARCDGRPPLPELSRTDPRLPQRPEGCVQDRFGHSPAVPLLRHRLLGGCAERLPEPGDKVLIARFGQFSHLWTDMCPAARFRGGNPETPWGEGAPVARYLASLRADERHTIRAVLVCQNEMPTGATSDVAAVRRAMDSVNHPAPPFVDSVSALGSIDFRMDDWAVDVCISGSQKGLMLPAASG